MLSSSAQERLSRAGISVLERGWLSSNNILLAGQHGPTALVDSGYCSHQAQTLGLVTMALGGRPLDLLLNTHLHSDHCGGNAALQNSHPRMRTLIPPGLSLAVRDWDEVALTYTPTGQLCPRFSFDGLLQPGDRLELGDWTWEVHGAKGHDPHSIVLFQPENRVLISADALWQNGFGVVFPELEGTAAFQEVGETLMHIRALSPAVVIPGHGPVFEDLSAALDRAEARLAAFVSTPHKHLRHAQKVLIKFRLLDWQEVAFDDLLEWVQQTPYLNQPSPEREQMPVRERLDALVDELERVNALKRDGRMIINT